MRNIDSQEQATILRKYYSNISPSILDSSVVFPLVAIFGNARPELGGEMDFSKIMHILVGSNIASSLRKQYLWICISSIINKYKMGNIINNLIQDFVGLISVINELKTKIFNPSFSIDCRQDSILIYAWMAKAIFFLNPIWWL